MPDLKFGQASYGSRRVPTGASFAVVPTNDFPSAKSSVQPRLEGGTRG